MAIESKGYAGTIMPGKDWAYMQYGLGSRYWVYNQDSVRVTPLAGGTRQVQISTGRFGAYGIHDFNNSTATVTLPTVASGTRWFLIVARRTWQTTNATTFAYIDCGTAPTYPTRNIDFGVIDDQPLAFVPLTAGQTVPGTPRDVRAMGTGKDDVVIFDELALGYLAALGVRCQLGKKVWRRVINATGTGHVWDFDPGPGEPTELTAVTTPLGSSQSGWTTSSGLPAPNQFLVNRLIRNGNNIQFTFRIRRIGGHVPVSDGSATDNLMFILGEDYRPDDGDVVYGSALYINTDGSNSSGRATLHSNGHISFVTGSGNRDLASKSSGYSLAATFNYIQSQRD